MLDDRLVFLDLETTGGNATRHRIIEVGLVAVEGGRVVQEWQTLVNPGRFLPSFIQQYTGIDDAMLEDAPRFRDVARQLEEMLCGSILVAHNARFDYGFLRNEFRRLGTAFLSRVLCTVRLSRALYPGQASHSLDAVIARHGLQCRQRHRAMDDAAVLWDFMQCALEDHGPDVVRAAMAEQLRRPTLPPGVDPGLIGQLPDLPGVYLFYDSGGRLLYVGKSVSIRKRVLSHFSGDHASNKEMRLSRQLADIRWIETAGELGALLLESNLIKEHAPVHNRRLRRSRSLYSWRLDTAGDFHRPVLISAATPDLAAGGEQFGLFRNRRAAKEALRRLCAANGLCPARVGLEKSAGPCFAYQLGRCRGACAGKETASAHNLRLMTALAAIRMTAWPFAGPVGIRERDPVGGKEAIHVVDNWCWLGSAGSDDEVREILAGRGNAGFDLDTYRILRGWLEGKGSRASIIPLGNGCQAELSSG